ncbi:hypothetical protein [Nostoc sp.]|nr:hypothetical protein [Nostoc sp. NMS9]
MLNAQYFSTRATHSVQVPHAHIHKISPQLVGNLTEILPQPLPNVGKV